MMSGVFLLVLSVIIAICLESRQMAVVLFPPCKERVLIFLLIFQVIHSYFTVEIPLGRAMEAIGYLLVSI